MNRSNQGFGSSRYEVSRMFFRGLIGFGVSGGLVYLMLQGIDLDAVKVQIQSFDTRAIFPVLTILAIIFAYKAFRWKYQLSAIKPIAFDRSLNAIVIGFTVNNAIPLRGGDLLRAHVLARRENVGTVAILASVGLEKVLDVAALFTFAVGMLLIVPLPLWIWNSVIILGVGVGGCVAGIITLRIRSKFLENRWQTWCGRLPDQWRKMLFSFVEQISLGLKTTQGKARLINLYLLAMGEWVLWAALAGFCLEALGIEASITVMMSIVLAIQLAILLPAAPGYIGVFDYAVMLTLLFYGFDRSIAFSGAVILHAIFVLPISVVGISLLIGGGLLQKGGVHQLQE